MWGLLVIAGVLVCGNPLQRKIMQVGLLVMVICIVSVMAKQQCYSGKAQAYGDFWPQACKIMPLSDTHTPK